MNQQKILIAFIALIWLSACSNKQAGNNPVIIMPGNAGAINTQIVISIGKLNITGYEFEKDLEKYKSNFYTRMQYNPATADLQQWKNDYVDKAYLLAGAYYKGYDNNRYIDTMVNSGEHLLAVQASDMLTPAANQQADFFKVKESKSDRMEYLKKQRFGVNNVAKMRTNDMVINALALKLDSYNYGPGHNFIKSDFEPGLAYELITYIAPNGDKKSVTVNDFINYYNTLFIKYDIYTVHDVRKNLFDMVYSDYAYNKAVEMGITKRSQFLLDMKNFKNTLIYRKYEDEVLGAMKQVSNAEIQNTYNTTKGNYTQATDAIASVYYLQTRANALSLGAILKIKPGMVDTMKIAGLIKVDKHLSINYKDTSLPDTLKKIIFNSGTNYVSRPVKLGNEFVLVHKETGEGERIQTLNEVKNKVLTYIKDKHIADNKKIVLNRLKTVYPMKINIDEALLNN